MRKILPKDTAIVNEIKKHLIYYATQLDSEYQRLKELIEKQNNNAFEIFQRKNIEIQLALNQFLELLKNKNKNQINQFVIKKI